MASINDVAKLAGVSKSTVSLVINNTGYVSEKTKKKVEKAIQQLDYIPSKLAQNFSKQHAGIVAIVVPDIIHPFFSTFLKHAEILLSSKGYMTIICNAVDGEHNEKKFIQMLNRKMVDGIIVAGHSIDVEEYKKSNRPIVSIDRYICDKISVVHSDHYKAAVLASDLFIKANCKHVVQFVGSKDVEIESDAFNIQCNNILKKNGVKVHSIALGHNTFSPEKYQLKVKDLFDLYPTADGVLGVDLTVLAVLKKAKEKNIRVPQDLKIVAYDGTYITRMNTPCITAIVQPIEEIAKQSVILIVDKISNELTETKKIYLPVSVQRGQTI